jgi:hypothetical protein
MLKVIGGLAVGAFVVGMVYSALKKEKPELVQGIEEKTSHTVNSFVEAFKEGYGSSTAG